MSARDQIAKAAPTPWTLEHDPDLGSLISDVLGDDVLDVNDVNDAALIVFAVNNLDRLLTENETMREALREIASYNAEERLVARPDRRRRHG